MNDATERRLELERKRREVLERKKKRIEEIRRQKLQSNPDIPSLANYKQRLSRLLSPTKSNIVESSQPSDQQEIKSTTPKTQSLGVERKEKRELKLVTNIAVLDIKPKKIETYEKEVQTIEQRIQPKEPETEKKEEEKPINVVVNEVEEEKQQTEEEQEVDIREIESSKQYQEFFSKASKIIQRTLNGHLDPFVDYTESDLKNQSYSSTLTREKVSLHAEFYAEKLCKNRAVTSLNWSHKSSELFIASYCSRANSAPQESDGIVLVWSLYLHHQPEFVFTAESSVSCVRSDMYRQNLIFGGTFLGQILVWDIRAKSAPVQRTPLNSRSHTHPVFGMEIIGTKNSNNLVTMSTDGKVCVWTMDKLSQPQETLELYVVDKVEESKVRHDIGAYTLGFPEGELNKFFIGCEDGKMYSAYRHGVRAGISEKYDGHYGPITGMHCHPDGGSIDFSDLIVTSSMDWSCKLWSHKSYTPLYSFEEYNDYVYDVKWSPCHPALFASVDGSGNLMLWNLNEDTETPIFSTTVCSRALNQICWSPDGLKTVVGSSDGHIFSYELNRDIAQAQSDNEWKKLEQILIGLSQQSL